MTKIVKSLSKKTKKEVEDTSLTAYCSWERLKPYIEMSIAKKNYENVVGIVADDDGIKILLEREKDASV